MDEATQDQHEVHSVNTPQVYTDVDGGLWMLWEWGKVDGRSLKKRGKNSVVINEITVHSLRFPGGREWDCVNGWRSVTLNSQEPAVSPAEAFASLPEGDQDKLVSSAIDSAAERGSPLMDRMKAQALAYRIFAGQSPDLLMPERLARVKAGLEAQGLSMDGVEL